MPSSLKAPIANARRILTRFARREWSDWIPSYVLNNVEHSDAYQDILERVADGTLDTEQAYRRLGAYDGLREWADLYTDLHGSSIPGFSGRAGLQSQHSDTAEEREVSVEVPFMDYGGGRAMFQPEDQSEVGNHSSDENQGGSSGIEGEEEEDGEDEEEKTEESSEKGSPTKRAKTLEPEKSVSSRVKLQPPHNGILVSTFTVADFLLLTLSFS